MARPEQLRYIRSNNSRVTTYSFPSKPLPHSFQMIFHDYDFSKFAASTTIERELDADGKETFPIFSANQRLGLIPERNPVQENSTSSVELPFPRSLRDATGTQVTAFERDFLTEKFASVIAGASNTGNLDAIGKLAEDALGVARDAGKAAMGNNEARQRLIEGIQGLEGTASDAMTAGTYLAKKYLSGDLAKTVGQVAGQIVNPQQTLAFEGVNLREFSFEWDLFPSNAADTEQITNIVNFLKSKMLPTTSEVLGLEGLSKAILKYPSIVEPSLLGVQEKHFPRFKRCMIDNVTVDYTGGGAKVGIIKGGVPASVTLSISFRELTIQTAEDYATLLPQPDAVGAAETGESAEQNTTQPPSTGFRGAF